MDANCSNKIFFSDEVHFTLGKYVNKQNCRIWGSENRQVVEERSLHPEKGVIDWDTDHYVSKESMFPSFRVEVIYII